MSKGGNESDIISASCPSLDFEEDKGVFEGVSVFSESIGLETPVVEEASIVQVPFTVQSDQESVMLLECCW